MTCIHPPATLRAGLLCDPLSCRPDAAAAPRRAAPKWSAWASMWAAVILAGCGGGGGSDIGLSSETAQGYAADAALMPVAAASAVDTAVQALEAAVATPAQVEAAGLPVGRAGTLAATRLATTSVNCANGGTVLFSITGATPLENSNGRFDAGETYAATFANCGGTTPGTVLDGRMSLVVTAQSLTAADFDIAAAALQQTTAQGRTVLDGSVRSVRASSFTANGGQLISSRLTSPRLSQVSTTGTRQSSYEVRTLDWTVVRTLDRNFALVGRVHQGLLDLAVSSPRRPAATLTIVTQGTLTLASDGHASQGSFSVATGQDKLSVTYGERLVSIALDIGNNGSIDRVWTLERAAFFGEAG